MEHGLIVNQKLVARIIRDLEIHGLPKRKSVTRNLANVATHDDLVNRNFVADRPNALWLTDITEHPTPCIPVVVATLRFVATLVVHQDAPQESPSRVLFSVVY